MLKASSFRIQNFKNIDDSGWIPLEKVTVFVGRNESGKSSLLKALHKFNPAVPEPYDPQRDFPRDRFTRDYKNGTLIPVCSVKFPIEGDLKSEMGEFLEEKAIPTEVICTRFYDGTLSIEFVPEIEDHSVNSDALIAAIKQFASSARRITSPTPEEEAETNNHRQDLASWSTKWTEKFKSEEDLCLQKGQSLLSEFRKDIDAHGKPISADIIEELIDSIEPIIDDAKRPQPQQLAEELIKKRLPVFIYFENYGIIDSTIFFPRFVESLKQSSNAARTRTLNAMFKHVQLSAEEILTLGNETTKKAAQSGQQVTDEMIKNDRVKKDERAIKLNSASLDITNRFNEWYGQRRHQIKYQADGEYFRIWVSDDRRPGVDIELEGRSKGFQWFFSFYLVFLVESNEMHKDSILLLDEPGLNLHPTAQQELISFFESLSEKNQILYTTHSPFLIDGDHIHRVRPVAEDDSGHSSISIGEWPRDRDTIFPLQAAAGYAMVRDLFQHKNNLLVEGMSDYYYLHALSHQCQRAKMSFLPDDIYITPCGGTKNVGFLSSLFLGQNVHPVILLDGDSAGRARRSSLMNELYARNSELILMLDECLGREGDEIEIEDILGEEILLNALDNLVQKKFQLNAEDRKSGSIVSQIEKCAQRKSIELPKGWKASVAIALVSSWAEMNTVLPDSVLEVADKLFTTISSRFDV